MAGKEISSLYVLKCIGAFLVVLLHTYMVGKSVLLPIANFAVPVFFIISGYFLPREENGKVELSRQKTSKAFVKILHLIVSANLFYLVVEILFKYLSIPMGFGASSFPDIRTPNYWICQILFGTKINTTLWFLNAYAIGVVLLTFVYKKFGDVAIVVVMIVGLLITAVVLKYGAAIFGFKFTNGLITAEWMIYPFIYVSAGYLIRKHKGKIDCSVFGRNLFKIFLVAFILMYAEVAYLRIMVGFEDAYRNSIFSFACICYLFLMFINRPTLGTGTYLARVGKNYSSGIYIAHIFMLWICNNIFGLFNSGGYGSVQTLVVFFVSLGVVGLWKNVKRFIVNKVTSYFVGRR